jgi:hypothetical protein
LKIDPFAYLKDVFERLPLCNSQDPASLESFLPDRWLAEHPECQLRIRTAESQAKSVRRRTRRTARRMARAIG